MAMVETPDRIMTTASGGGWGGECGSGMWILLLAFLFMFRGRGGFGDGCEGGGYPGTDVYKRHDAEFAALNRNEWDLQKEGLVGRYESRLQNLESCCQTNQNIKDTTCAVHEEGGKTRALLVDLQLKEQLARQQAEIAALSAKLNRQETVAETLRGVHGMLEEHGHGGKGCGCHPVYAQYEPLKYAPVPPGPPPGPYPYPGYGEYNDYYRYEAI